jgi:hypothetical protein
MYSLVNMINSPSSSYGYGSKLDKPQEDDDDQSTGSITSKDKRGKLGFRSVLKKCVSFRGLSNKTNDSSSRSLTTELAFSMSTLSMEESDIARQVVVRGKAPSSKVKAPSSPKLLLPTTNRATSKRPGLPPRSSSVRSLHFPRAVSRKEKRMNVRRSHSARPFSTETEEVQTRSLENAKKKCRSLHDFLEEYDDIIMLDDYAELTPFRQQTKESSLADCLDAYSRIIDED